MARCQATPYRAPTPNVDDHCFCHVPPASQALARHSSGRGESVPITILEGLVPGLDFANHRVSPGPQCWWEVVVPERQQPADGEQYAGH